MSYFLFIIVLAVSFFIGVFGFSQIIGSLQNIKNRGIGLSLFTIILWCGILAATFFIKNRFFPDNSTAYYIGMGASLVAVLMQGKIQ